uniref:Peptidase n=1 Tax=uncultured marine bacterium EB0_39H12 TaxID=415437 RepID=A4GHX8_9BACT|nr:peptidase [uncultured marine bacterium EB0_39H12]
MNKLFISLLMFSNISLISAAETIETEAVEWLKAYLQIETVNPPGNESRAVDYIANIFEQEGIEFNSAESAPGRGNIWARIEGGDKPALVLLHHSDVVPVNEKYWDFDPFSGEIKDGYILGRGALDMKGTGISHLANFINLHRQGKKLNRDVIFIGAADEESGGNFGVGWLVKNHPEIFEGAGLLLNEGGSGYKSNDSIVFSVEITQKVPVWLRLTAIDTPGHGSSPRSTSSVSRVVKALNIIWNNPFPPRIIPEVEKVFIERSGGLDEPYSSEYRNIKESIKDPIFMKRLQSFSASAHALTRDTCSLTRMMGSSKINVVPPEAWAEVDCRMLPDRTTDEFISDFKALIKDTGVEVELIMSAVPAISQTDSELFLAIEDFSKNNYPGSRVAPSVSTGFTDSRFTRGLGIQSYGFNPLISTGDEYSSIHGNNERINEKAFRQSVKDLGIILDKILY